MHVGTEQEMWRETHRLAVSRNRGVSGEQIAAQ
jgi:hypothetical protein